METNPISKTLCSLEYWMIDEVQKPSNSQEYEEINISRC
jgi:hypothetical protein